MMLNVLTLVSLFSTAKRIFFGGEEFLSTTEAVPPNVLFVVERSSAIAPCESTSSASCFDTAIPL